MGEAKCVLYYSVTFIHNSNTSILSYMPCYLHVCVIALIQLPFGAQGAKMVSEKAHPPYTSTFAQEEIPCHLMPCSISPESDREYIVIRDA